jgi:hypothetical protein
MNPQIPAPCSLTHVFTGESKGSKTLYLNDFPEPISSIIDDLKTTFQELQMAILDGNPDNVREIGDCFKNFEVHLDQLISKFSKHHANH